MAKPNSSTGIQVESIVYPPSAKPPGATNTLFLGGAGVRGLDIEGKFVKFSGIGVYLEYKAISLLAVKWKGKSVEELTDSVVFYRDIVTGRWRMISDGVEDEEKWLTAGIAGLQRNAFYMHRALNLNNIKDRLAPEYRHPAQHDDGFDVLKFLDIEENS